MSATPDILGVAELARAAGVKDRTLTGYLSRGQCPEPDYRLACGPVWRRETVQPWIDARDRRVESVLEAGDAAWGQEVSMLSEYVYRGHLANKSETARRNVHNGKLRRMRERTGNENLRRKNQGLMPTLRDESRELAERLIQTGQAPMLETDPSVIERRNRAVALAARRQANRTGTTDGIPF